MASLVAAVKKILFHSNAPWVGTGYGSQTEIFVPRIAELGYDLAISAFWGLGGAAQDWNGIKVYPSDEAWGNRWIAAYAAHHSGGTDPRDTLVLTLGDVWVYEGDFWPQLNVASWVPIDHDPVPPRVKQFFARTRAIPIAMSRFGEDKLRDEDLDPLYVPHGVVTDLLTRKPDARSALGLPQDAFVVGMVAANKGVTPPRKAFPQVFEAFAELRKNHSDAILYLHTQPQSQIGLDLIALAEVVGIPKESMRWTPAFQLDFGIPYSNMSYIYSLFDVLASPSYGEGFGIPIMEAQSCGVPVIVSDFSAMPELVGAGWTTGGQRTYDATQGSWWIGPDTGEIYEAMEAAYGQSDEDRAVDADKARAKALEYDAEVVTERYWRPVLLEVLQRIAERKVDVMRNGQMPEVRLNRRARRAAAKR